MKTSIIVIITIGCMSFAPVFGGCGGGGSGTTTTEDAVDTSGGDGTEEGETELTTDEIIANALARFAINAALNIGLGLFTDDAEYGLYSADPGTCGVEGLPPPPGFPPPPACNVYLGENSLNCPEDCSCGDGVCDDAEDAASCPGDCTCGNGTCDVYGAGEDSISCPNDCDAPVCGDGVCSMEELFTGLCVADCWSEHMRIFGGSAIPMIHGIPAYKCEGAEMSRQGSIAVQDTSTGEIVGRINGKGICSYGYRSGDTSTDKVDAVFVDFEVGMFDIPLDTLTFTCTERTYDYRCMEGSALLVFNGDGTLAFHTALSGKLYVYREGGAGASYKEDSEATVARIVAGAAAGGTITLPPASAGKTCVDMTFGEGYQLPPCPKRYHYGYVSAAYNYAHAYYLEADGSITGPDAEVCQSFMIPREQIRPDAFLGDPITFHDEDGNGLAACDDPACVDHPLCRLSYCDLESEITGRNYHGSMPPACCPECNDGICAMIEGTNEDLYCATDCDGNGLGVCTSAEVDGENYSADCCGDGKCIPPEEDALSCPSDCDLGGACDYDGVCEPDNLETSDSCHRDNGGDCWCGDGVCDGAERRSGLCPEDCD